MDLKGLLNITHTILYGHYGGGGDDGGENGKSYLSGDPARVCGNDQAQEQEQKYGGGFQMPLHYPRYKKEDYETMEEWKLDLLLNQYGLMTAAYHQRMTLQEKREFAIGAFVWPSDHHDDENRRLS